MYDSYSIICYRREVYICLVSRIFLLMAIAVCTEHLR